MKTILRLKDNEYPFTYIDHHRKIARAILINEKGEIALNKIHGFDMFGSRNYYETPGGGFKKSETSKEALFREIKEETGYKCEIICPLGIVDDYYNLIHRHNKSFYYLCKVSQYVGKHLDEYEKSMIEKVVWMDIDSAIKKYEEMRKVSPVARLVSNRELPILKKVKEVL